MSQKLLLHEIDKRVGVTIDRSILADGVNGVMRFGEKNDYPQRMERLIDGSVTAKGSASIYAKFLTGEGFSEEVNKQVVGYDSKHKKITVRRILSEVCESISYNMGAYVHLDRNLIGENVSAKHVLFKNCRFSKLDERGYTSKIGYYENWQKEKGLKYNKSKIVWYNIYNSNLKVLLEQVKTANGIENYKGQIYLLFLDNKYLYPLSTFDSAYIDCDTENQIGLHKNNEARNGFTKKTLFQVNEQLEEESKGELAKNIKSFMGSRGNPAMIIETETDENGNILENKAVKIDTIDASINSKLFENWELPIANKIRKAIKAIPAILIDYEQGKLGTTSGEAITQAVAFYNGMTKDDRKSISEMFEEIFSNFDNEVLKENKDWTIKPFKLINNGTNTDI